MIRINFITIVLFLLGFCFFQADDADAISWTYDLELAFKRAKENQKPVMVDFYTDWCGWCKRLDKVTYADQKVRNLSARFICVKINGNKNAGLVRRYGIRGYPTILFFNSNGNAIERIPGYVEPATFAEVMDKVLAKTAPSLAELATKQKEQYSRFRETTPTSSKKQALYVPFELTGIIYDPENPKAIINGKILTVGDQIAGAKIVEISVDEVKLSYRGGEFVLSMSK